MILRALFWITVVAVLMPHEPDLGLGRPSLSMPLGSDGALHCPHRAACATAFGFLDHFQAMAVRNLAEVKADIERGDRSRAGLRDN